MDFCIICNGNNPLSTENPLTDEHIVPEFMGGNLTVRNVCKICNGNMGRGFEGRLSNNFIYKSARFLHDIAGKSGTPFPFDEVYYHEDSNSKFTVNKDGTIKSLPSLSPIEETDTGIQVHISVDIREEDTLRPMLEKQISRYVKSKGRDASNKIVSDIVEKILSESSPAIRKIDNPQVQGRISINLEDIELLHIKIAYELACYHFGSEYLFDAVAEQLRLSLLQQKLQETVRIQTPMENDPFKSFIDDEFHWVIFSSLGCYVSAFGLNSFLMYTSEDSIFISANGVAYKFCYKTRTYSVGELIDVVRHGKA